MKTHDLSRHLEQLARLLRQMPDIELDNRPGSFFQDILLSVSKVQKPPTRTARELPTNIQELLSQMPPKEIEAFLQSDSEGFTASNLAELASRLGITSSKRPNKNALVNMITRHYEAGRMHAIMRSSPPKKINEE